VNALAALVERMDGDPRRWSDVVGRALGRPVEVRSAVPLGRQGGKALGMTASVELLVAEPGGGSARWYLKLPDESVYGEDLAADASREVAWRLEGYPRIANHVVCRKVALPEGCCLLEPAVAGEPYWRRLARLAEGGETAALRDARLLAEHLADLHRPLAGGTAPRYRRAVRDGLMNAAFRLIDAGDAFWYSWPALRAEVEHAFLDWRLRLGDHHRRLKVTHNDFHPWNLFLDGDRVNLIGARAPGFGDAANDVAALAVNYVWFGYLRDGDFTGVYRAAYEVFCGHYVALTGDRQLASVLPPFFAMRLLVLLSPLYYPDKEASVERQLRRLLPAVLHGRVDPLGDPEAMRT
jgi:Ser/Thr protein kinase RdoA (MazF antagonist)